MKKEGEKRRTEWKERQNNRRMESQYKGDEEGRREEKEGREGMEGKTE